jgi:microcystin-dependent protein
MSGYASTKYSASGVKTGTIVSYGSNTAPDGFLDCDGTAVSRTTYASLFAVIGTTYGTGDGSSTFNLPDLQDNVPLGKSGTKSIGSTGGSATQTTTGSVSVGNTTLSTSKIPSHTHTITQGGALNQFGARAHGCNTSDTTQASSSTGGGGSHNHSGTFTGSSMSVLQPYVATNFCIKT